jgi:hypothetical protein
MGIAWLVSSCTSHVDVGSARDAGVPKVDGGGAGSRPDAGLAWSGGGPKAAPSNATDSKLDGTAIARTPSAFHPRRP